MHKSLKTIFKIAFWLLAILSAFFFFPNIGVFVLNPFETAELDMVNVADMDADGYVYVIDNGSARIIKTDLSGNTEFILNNGKTFSYAKNIAVGDGHAFYVHDITWNGLKVHSERILAFEKKSGKFIDTVFECVYDQRPTFPLIKSIGILDGSLWFVQTDDNGFTVNAVDEADGELRTLLYEPFADASRVLQDFCVTGDGVLMLDKAGIVSSLADGQLSIVYAAVSGDDISQFSLPLRISKDESIYYADIGRRSIGVLEDGGQRDFCPPDLSVSYSEMPIYYSVKACRGVVLYTDTATVYIADSDGRIISQINALDPSSSLIALRISLFAALILAAIALLIGLAKLLSGIKILSITNKQQTTLVVIIVSLLVSVSIVPGIMQSFEKEARGEILNRLSTLTLLSQNILDAEAYQNIRNPQDYYSDDYTNLMHSLESMVNESYEWNDNIYVVAYKAQGENLYPVAFLDGSMGAFYSYGDVYEGSNFEYVCNSGGDLVTDDNIVDISGSYMAVTGPIFGKDRDIIGAVEIGIDLYAFNDGVAARLRQLLVTAALTISILVFVLVEGVDAIHVLSAVKKLKASFSSILLPVPYIRIVTFVINMAFNFTTGFLPIYAGRFKAAFWGISPEMCAALPLTANLVLIAVASLLCGGLMRRFGMRKIFAAGALLCVIGETLNATAQSFGIFVVGMSISGIGAGLVFSFMNIYIASLEDTEQKTKGFSLFNSAGFSGMNCGVLIGAAFAVVAGQTAVFYLSAAAWFVSLSAFFLLINRNRIAAAPVAKVKHGFINFLTSGSVWKYLLLFFSYTTLNGFLFFFVPVFSAEQGLSETEISLIFILHAISLSLIGPLIIRRLKEIAVRYKAILSGAMALSIAALLVVAYYPGIVSVAIAVFILGCSNSIGYIYFPLFFSEMEQVRIYGTDKSMSAYGSVENIGSAAGPFVFGWAPTPGLRAGFAAISAAAAAVTVLFAAAKGRVRKRSAGEESVCSKD